MTFYKVTEIQASVIISKNPLLYSPGATEAIFHVDPSRDWGTKVCSGGFGQVAKIAGMLIYGKDLKIFFTKTKKANDLGTVYITLGILVLQRMFN